MAASIADGKLDEALEVEQFPGLHIRIMSDNDVAVMRAQQHREDAELNRDLAGMTDEDETVKWLSDRRPAQADHDDDDPVIQG